MSTAGAREVALPCLDGQEQAMDETHVFEKKSYRKAFGPTADLSDLAKTCVCLANAQGGTLLIGIEDRDEAPPAGQQLDAAEVNAMLKKLSTRAVNVSLAAPEVVTAPGSAQFVRLGCLQIADCKCPKKAFILTNWA